MRGSLAVEPKADSRTRRLVRGIGTAFLSRGMSALATIAVVPIALPAMGVELYGVWMTVVALTSMILWADLGLGNGLLTRLTTAWADGDVDQSRRLVSSAYAATSVAALLLVGVLWLSASVLDVAALLGASNTSQSGQAELLGLVCLTLFIVNIPLSLVQRVMYATQRVAEANLWQALGPVLALLFAFGATAVTSSAVLIAGAASCGVVAANLLSSIRVYVSYGAGIRPAPQRARFEDLGDLISLGAKFFVLSIVTSTSLGIDTLVVNHVLGLTAVAIFAVQARIANLMGMVINLVNLPLWPAAGEALARGDVLWIRRTIRTMMAFSFVCVAAGTIVIVVAGPSAAGWLGVGAEGFDRALFVAFGLWWTAVAATSPLAMVQNSRGVVLPQLVGWTLFLVISLPSKVVAVDAFGAWAAPTVGFITFMVTVAPAQVIGYHRAVRGGGVATSAETGPT